ncbi:MAG: M20/M25/M40 family metallo-hydrolase [Planctomycetota bacterium]|nr:M20/M25/M40 family metallo-hydrolase [Planctomycetota bacterium]
MSDLAVKQLLELLAIPGPPGKEQLVAERIQAMLREAGVPDSAMGFDRAQDRSEYGGETGNLIVRLDGNGRGARRLFSCHMDTVPNAAGTRPVVESERVVSGVAGKALGGDNRTGCAAVLEVARALSARKGDHAPATLVFLIQEEVGLVGARGLDLQRLGAPFPSLGFNFDGGKVDELVTAVIGTRRFTIELTGREAHAGAHPEEGVSCAIVAARALSELHANGWHGPIEKPDGRGSANVGIQNGGQGSNVVMPRMSILAEARSHDPIFRRRIVAAWEDAFRRAAAETRNARGDGGSVAFGPGPAYEAFVLSEREPAVRLALRAAEELKVPLKRVSNNGGMDANWLTAHGIPTVTLGVGQRNVHKPDEWIDLPEFRRACALASRLATFS